MSCFFNRENHASFLCSGPVGEAVHCSVVLDRLAGPGQTGLRQTVFYPESECPVCSAGRAVQPGQARQDVTGLYLQSALGSGSLAPHNCRAQDVPHSLRHQIFASHCLMSVQPVTGFICLLQSQHLLIPLTLATIAALIITALHIIHTSHTLKVLLNFILLLSH